MSRRRTRFAFEEQSPIELKSHEQRMQLEARRDYLKWYLDPSTIKTPDRGKGIEAPERKMSEEQDYSEELKKEISGLEQALCKRYATNNLFLEPLLLPYKGKDADGISRTLSDRFAQLFEKDFKDFNGMAAAPFVQLSGEGLEFYWGTQKQADKFADILKAHHLTPQVINQPLDEKFIPKEAKESAALKKLYCNKGATYKTKIPHLQAEKLLRLAQYHPYHLKAAQSEWYEARKLEHAQVAILEALGKEEKGSSLPPAFSPLQVGGMQRVAYDHQKKEQVVKATINTRITPDAMTPPAHVVILLDDSGSMDGKKMVAANKALKKLIMETLDEETLVTIQPMNADTLAYRKTVKELREQVNQRKGDHYFNTPANGGTPLAKLLVNSAVFLRDDPRSTIISESALRNTVIVPITDGQDEDSFTADQVVSAMQTSMDPHTATGIPLLGNIKLPTGASTSPISYGVGGFQCRQLPAVLPIRIGANADVAFSRKLADYLHAPEAFVNDEVNDKAKDKEEVMQRQIDYALSLVVRMSSRVPEALVGLIYEDETGKEQVLSVKGHNFFHMSSRDIFFKVPQAAKNLRICLVVDDQPVFISCAPTTLTEEEVDVVINQYVNNAFDELLKEYFTKQNVTLSSEASMSDGRGGGRRGGRDLSGLEQKTGSSSAGTKKEKEALKNFEENKTETQEKIKDLLLHTKDSKLKGLMETFLHEVQAHQYKQAFPTTSTELYLARGIAASQQRVKPIVDLASLPVVPDGAAKRLSDHIQNGEFKQAKALLMEDKNLINDTSGNTYQASPLIYALIKLRDLKAQGKDLTQLRQFISDVLLNWSESSPDLLLQDKPGNNTALHRAAWCNEGEICKKILKLAKWQGTLKKLLALRNSNTTGATQNSETPLDNMRTRFYASDDMHPKDSSGPSELFKELHQLAAESTKSYTVEDKENVNAHLYGAKHAGKTQLMAVLMEVHKGKKPHYERDFYYFLEKKKNAIFFAESDYKGDTLFSEAIALREFCIAEKILDEAKEAKQLPEVLAARNIKGLDREGNGGQVPHMALAELGSECVKNFFEAMEAAKPLIITHAVKDLTFQAWLRSNGRKEGDLEQKVEPQGKDSAHTMDAQFTLAVLQKMKDTVDLTGIIGDEIEKAYDACRNLLDWHRLAKKLNDNLTAYLPQKAEFNHLCTVYGKQIEGYNAKSFLQACPIYEFGRVKRMHLAFSLNHPGKRKEINQLVDYLNKIQACSKGNNLDHYIRELQSAHKKLKNSFQTGSVDAATVELLEMSSLSAIKQYQAYVDGRLNTLLTLAQAGMSVTEKNLSELSESLESFNQSIECLKVYLPSSSSQQHTTEAFSSFFNVLANDQLTSPVTKKIICSHFEDITKKFMTEELVSLDEINSLEKNLQVKLVGKPPMSPKVKAAVGVLVGTLAGAAVILTGGMALVPGLALGLLVSGSLGTVGLFQGRKTVERRQNDYNKKVQPLRNAMNQLGRGTTS